MGWARGSEILTEIIESVKSIVTDHEDRETLYRQFIEIFENNDADTLDECLGIDRTFDKVYKEYFEEYDQEYDTDEDDYLYDED